MASALMALTHASLLQQGKTSLRSLDRGNKAEKSDAPGPEVVKPGAHRPAAQGGAAAEGLQHLLKAVKELSHADQMLEKAQRLTPAGDGEARKWHQASLTAMRWTRQAQAERVHSLLRALRCSAVSQRGTAGELGQPGAVEPPPGLLAMVSAPGPCTAGHGGAGCEESAALACGTEAAVAEAEVAKKAKIGSLRSDLQGLREKDPGCCLIVRRIKPLGLESREMLRAHFGRVADVEEVHVSHSFEKPNSKHSQGRVRPAALGFVVMASRGGAEKVLAAGSEQLVGDARISVRLIEPFDCRD